MQIYLCFQLALPHSVSYFFFFYQLSLLCLCTQFLMLFHLTEMRLSRSQIVNFPTWIPDCDFHSSAFLDLFISSGELVFVLQWLFSIGKFWSCGCLSFYWLPISLKMECHASLWSLWLFSYWCGRMFHDKVSLDSVLLQLLMNLWVGSGGNGWIYPSS